MPGDREPWHLDKRVPVALIFAILLQTGTAFWWAASIQERVGNAEQDIVRIDARTDAIRDIAQDQAVQLGRIEEQINGLRNDIGRLLSVMERINR